MKYLFDKWNQKCSCHWKFTDPNLVNENWEPVEGTICIDLNATCLKHSEVHRWLVLKGEYTKVTLTLLKQLEMKDKNNTLFMNRLGLIFQNEL